MSHKLLLPLALCGAVLPLSIVGCGGGNGPLAPQPNATAIPTTSPTANPTTTPTTSPTMTPTTTPPTVSGQRFVGQFSAASGANANTSAIDWAESSSSNFDFSGNSGVTSGYSSETLPNERTIAFTLFTPASGTVKPGSYAVKARPVSTASEASAFYNEGPKKGWEATGGTIIVDSVQGDIYKFRWVDVTMVAGRRFGSTDSQGTFTMSGTGQARVVCRTLAECR